MRKRSRLSVGLVAVALLVAPTPATAADTFVDDDRPDNNGDCLTPATACQTLIGALGGVAKAGPNDTVRVDGGTYTGFLNLGNGKSLIEQEFNAGDGDTQAILDGGGSSAVSLSPGATAGTIQGFNLRTTGNVAALNLDGPATSVTGNTFDSTGANTEAVRITTVAAGASTIGPGNIFTDDGNDAERRLGVRVLGGAAPTVTGNTFSQLSEPIILGAPGSPMISGNTITGVHTDSGLGGGRAIAVFGGATPTIVGNNIHSPDINTFHTGVDIVGGSSGATMRRNRILDHTLGLVSTDAAGGLAMHSDVVLGGNNGLRFFDTGATAVGEGDATVTNLTVAGTGLDITIQDGVLTLNSSIVEDAISTSGTVTCMISFSRGFQMLPGGTGCDDFQTTAAPMFAGDGYHLLVGSPMIDMGDQTAPLAPNNLDVDGEARAIDADGACPLDRVRDIGADEFAATEPFCPAAAIPPLTGSTPQTPASAKKKKCKKKKRTAAAKKCKRRKK